MTLVSAAPPCRSAAEPPYNEPRHFAGPRVGPSLTERSCHGGRATGRSFPHGVQLPWSVSQRNARLGLAAANDRKVRAECSERLCRRQPNAIGGTRDQDLLVVHGTAIQANGSREQAGRSDCDRSFWTHAAGFKGCSNLWMNCSRRFEKCVPRTDSAPMSGASIGL